MDVSTQRQVLITSRAGVVTELRRGPKTATTLAPHFHEEMQVILAENRLISYTLKGAKILSPLGSTFIIEPEVVHSAIVEDVQRSWGDLRTLLLPRSCFSDLFGDALKGFAPVYESPVCRSPYLREALVAAHGALQNVADKLDCELVLLRALHALVLHSKSQAAWRTQRCDRRLNRVRDRLGSDLDRNISLSEVARWVELSPFHVAREFHRTFGMSPHAFRVQMRIAKAKEFLYAKVPLSDIAQATGFSDHAHLTRTFRRFVGVPPSKYIHSKIVQDSARQCK